MMARREVHLELLLHRRVWTPSGASLGRIEEIGVNEKGEILEFRLGPEALWKRWLGRLRPGGARALRVPWRQMDLAHPERPRLRGALLLKPQTHS